MNNPYEILGLTPDATEEEVKSAYYKKLLAYRADSKDSPLDDFAQEKLNELNAAYDQILGKKSNPSGDALVHAEAHIRAGRLFEAERILSEYPQHENPEWCYLMGLLYEKRGWYDRAEDYFTEAQTRDPQNPRYADPQGETFSRRYQEHSNGMGYQTCCPCPLPCICLPCCC